MTTRGNPQCVFCPNPSCGESYEVDPQRIGGQTTCGKCGTEFRLTPPESVDSDSQARSAVTRESETSQVQAGGQQTAPARKGSVEVPDTFGHYRMVRELGRGGMAVVYLAEDSTLKRPVAIKIPFDDPRHAEQTHIRFLREAQAAASVSHPNICHVYEAREFEGRSYLAMEYIDGKPLSEILRGTPVTGRQAAGLIRKIALALAAAHDAGLVHRDLKPSNVMLTRSGEPKVTDFGLARAIVRDDSARITHTGAVLGTPAYMPREQALGEEEKIGPVSDVYSLGVMLYELLSGRLPFEGPASAVLGQVIASEPPPPSSHVKDLDQELEAICLKAMSKEPDDRFQSMREFADSLTEWIQSTTVSGETIAGIAGAVQERKPPRQGRKRTRQVTKSFSIPWWGIGGVACLLLGIGIALVTLPHDTDSPVVVENQPPESTIAGDINEDAVESGSKPVIQPPPTPDSDETVTAEPPVQDDGMDASSNSGTSTVADATPQTKLTADPKPPAPRLPKTVVVGPEEGMVATMRQAMLTAEPGDVIEVQTDEPLVIEPTIYRDLEGLLTIRSGEGFQPVLVRPHDVPGHLFHITAANNSKAARFILDGLTFVNLTPENQPGQGPQHHVLFLGCPFAVRHCVFISSNGAIGYSHEDVGYSTIEESGTIKDCYFLGVDLGGRSFRDIVQCGAGNVRLSNNLFVSGRMPLLCGSGCGGEPEDGSRCHLTLIHNTFVNCNQFFALFGRSSIVCRDNLIAYQRAHIVADGTGAHSLAAAREFLEYQGTSNAFYEFRWQIYSSNYRTGSDVTVWDFLTRSGETNPHVLTGASCFRQPNIASGRMPGIFSPQAYALRGDRRLIAQATDGENIGVDVARLPELSPIVQQIVLESVAGN